MLVELNRLTDVQQSLYDQSQTDYSEKLRTSLEQFRTMMDTEIEILANAEEEKLGILGDFNKEKLKDAEETWNGIADIVKGTAGAMTSSLSQGFFDVITNETKDLGEVFRDFSKDVL